MSERSGFYVRTLERLLAERVASRDMSVLVVAGGEPDRDALAAAGFADVTISNIDEDVDAAAFAPYRWERQDAEALSYGDGSFDLGVVSAGLHHCRSPHRALLELYRVSRRALLAIESRDSALMRVAARVGLVGDYELEAVASHGFRHGGVRNTNVPNYVYRWTEREVAKTIAAHAPHARHRVLYFHEFELPASVVGLNRSRPLRVAFRALEPVARGVTKVLPSQANLFAFVVVKPELPRDLQPWLRLDGGQPVPDEEWLRARYLTPD